MRWLPLVLMAACYAPHAEPGSPCDPGPCPSSLVCSPATHTCEAGAVDAAGRGVDVMLQADSIDAPEAAWLAGYAHRKRIVLAPVATTTQASFPVSIVEPADPQLAAGARSDAQDIVFTGGDGLTVLAYEIADFASTTGALDAWVRVDLPPTPVDLYMYYTGPPVVPSKPWSAGFAGVWHMGGTLDTVRDPAGNHDATQALAAAQPANAPGIVGRARNFDGLDDTMSVGDPVDGSLDFGTTSFSLSIWVNVAVSVGLYDTPLHKGGSSASQAGYDFELGTGPWASHFADGVAAQTAISGDETTLLNAWQQLTVVVDRGASQITTYTNGLKVTTLVLTIGSVSNAVPLTFSRPTFPFKGVLDEVRIYTRALSRDWIATEYANLANRSLFVKIGGAQDH